MQPAPQRLPRDSCYDRSAAGQVRGNCDQVFGDRHFVGFDTESVEDGVLATFENLHASAFDQGAGL